jgi:hypothetical protein
VLGSGLWAFNKGKSSTSQLMMVCFLFLCLLGFSDGPPQRLRVIAQGATVLVLVIGSWRSGVDFTKKQEAKLLDERR